MFGTARLSLLTGMLCLFTTPLAAGTFSVDDLGDAPDAILGDGVCATIDSRCTLRAAIAEANAIAGADTIAFTVAGTISPETDLPTILQRTTIDGTTAPGYAGVPVVVLDGGDEVSIGLNFGATANASHLSGLKVIGFGASGVNITASDVRVQHNYIGPIGGGTANFDGIVVSGTGNQIGTGEAAGNVISGNAHDGVVVSGSGHRLVANRIGTTADGMSALGNGHDGIKVFDSATNIYIGGESSFADHRNIVCANGDDGIELQNASNVTIGGNDVGFDRATETTIANADHAIELTDADDNTLSVPNDTLTISSNGPSGILIASGSGNTIGVGLTGDGASVANGEFENAPALPPVKSKSISPLPAAGSSRWGEGQGEGRSRAESQPLTPALSPRRGEGEKRASRAVASPAAPVPTIAKREATPEKAQPWIPPALPASPRSRLGLMFLAVGTAFAAFLRLLR